MPTGLGNKILVGLVTAMTAALAWQAWTLTRLEGRIAVLEQRAAPALPPAAPIASPPATSPPLTPEARAPVPPAPPSPAVVDPTVIESAVEKALRRSRPEPDPEAVDAAVGRVLERRQSEKFAAQGEHFLRRGADRIDRELKALVSEGTIPEPRYQEVLDLMVGELRETWRIKTEAREKELGHDEAYEQWEEVRAEYTEALGGLVGEETARLLRERLEGAGK